MLADGLVEQLDEHDAVVLTRLNRCETAEAEHAFNDDHVLKDLLDIGVFVEHSFEDGIADVTLTTLADVAPGIAQESSLIVVEKGLIGERSSAGC